MQTAYPEFQNKPGDWVDLDHQQLADRDPRLQLPLQLRSYAREEAQHRRPAIHLDAQRRSWLALYQLLCNGPVPPVVQLQEELVEPP
jgi:hypothetical protein